MGIDRGIGGIFGGRMVASEEQPEFELEATAIDEEKWLLMHKLKE